MKNVVVLISGRGSNMESLLEHAQAGFFDAGQGRIAAVIANRPEARGLEIAEDFGVPTAVVDHRDFADRESFDAELARTIDGFSPDLVVLAGFMRILSPGFIAHYERRLLNIHPSLLPSFPGLHTHARALDAGVKLHGATVHFVTADLDAGPIVMQVAVPVHADDDEDTLAERVLAQEHRIYPEAVRRFLEDELVWEDDRVLYAEPAIIDAFLVSPDA
ncbi:MAG: phosphoribosylglycinamide formyltransferase [Zoogloeaceae bacterium]|jgi:phosphoribosylglycinamide formyltransferase-1|nr:phosphoribosylglycinamide formyltransferase [Zoogloeaceae bacterium]